MAMEYHLRVQACAEVRWLQSADETVLLWKLKGLLLLLLHLPRHCCRWQVLAMGQELAVRQAQALAQCQVPLVLAPHWVGMGLGRCQVA